MNSKPMIPIAALSLSMLATLGLNAQAGSGIEETKVVEEETPLSYQLPAQEDNRRVQHSIAVGYADLNLNHNAGLEVLYQRLESATIQVCGPREDGRNIALYRDQQRCLNRAMDGAIAKIGHLGLDDMHLARSGRRVDRGQAFAGR
ncbi:UrcA family protein [Parahaliea sp. F7430]|uniref:UrcA family protein n=1 Tax=Sediminihaliea albiluteola TaxID=2758564 RepID=A0A7W2TWF8_9GAMM|nr:UrcA family protein [Sediminihaliea albiluteola]MBA6413177.1 UrcA family protein [Sediminihaliea albiluteola]